MSAIFISHNSADAKEAVALKCWLADNGWADVFLDIDAKDGLSPGERWKDALRTAADRCEAVLCLVSPTWLASAECKLEFRYAEQLRKHLFLAIIKPCDPKDLPPDWQWCPLYGDGAQKAIHFEFREQPAECAFLSSGLERLKNGLEKAGISAEHFPWPPANDPDRAPYRGLKPLEAADAAVLFGRNAQTLHGMETLWDIRRTGIERLLVILGASGSGKSSFMRAGLLPRLARNERQFFPLPVIRPRNVALFGAEGLAPALAAAFTGLGRNLTLGAIEKELNAGAEAFETLLAQLEQRLLEQRPLEPIAGEAEPQPPSLVIPIDQTEELFNPDGAAEAAPFLDLLGRLLSDRDPPGMSAAAHRRALVVLTIRSDRYERLQTAPGLSEIKPRLFDLRPFPPRQFERVINGPAERATQAGRKLKIEPRLTERLLADFSEGADTLPLLGFTLEKLYHKYGGDGDLTFEDYESIRGSHETVQAAIFQEAIDSALSEPYRPPPIPAEHTEQYQGLRRAFIPFLARINPESSEPMRQVAKLRDLPADVHPLVERLVEARLLIRDKDTIEVAHESLLRQWPSLRGWLTEDRDKLRLLENIRQSAAEWQKEDRHEDFLIRGGRLEDAEDLLEKPGYKVSADSDERAYLNACTAAQKAREAAEKEEQERRIRDAERIAEEERKVAAERKRSVRNTRIWLGVAMLVAGLAVWQYFEAERETQRARMQAHIALSQRVAADARRQPDDRIDRALLLTVAAHTLQPTPEAELGLLTSLLRSRLQRIERRFQPASSADVSASASASNPAPTDCPPAPDLLPPADAAALAADAEFSQAVCHRRSGDGQRIAAFFRASQIGTARFPAKLVVWNRVAGSRSSSPSMHFDPIHALAFSPDATALASADVEGVVSLWSRHGDTWEPERLANPSGPLTSLEFEPAGEALVGISLTGDRLRWGILSPRALARPLDDERLQHSGWVRVVFVSGGRLAASSNIDGRILSWDLSEAEPRARELMRLPGVRALAATRSGEWIAAASDYEVRVLHVPSGQQRTTQTSCSRISGGGLSLSDDGRSLVVGGNSCLRLWKFNNPGEPVTLTLPASESGRVYAATLSGDGSTLWLGGSFGLVQWRLAADRLGSPQRLLRRMLVTKVASSTPYGLLAAGTWRGEVWLVPVSGHKPPLLLGRHAGGAVLGLAFSPSADLLVSIGTLGTGSMWNVRRGEPLLQDLRTAGAGGTTDMAFSEDGRFMAAGSGNRVLSVWPMNVEAWRVKACAIANRNLSYAEWRKYMGDEPYHETCPDLPGPDDAPKVAAIQSPPDASKAPSAEPAAAPTRAQ